MIRNNLRKWSEDELKSYQATTEFQNLLNHKCNLSTKSLSYTLMLGWSNLITDFVQDFIKTSHNPLVILMTLFFHDLIVFTTDANEVFIFT